ncbi:DUF3089 domain-containing protein [Roseibium salinum]|nr:DUF3089 domain-containing protein [Roseibium salinum]
MPERPRPCTARRWSFSGQANLYAPFYRQMNLAGFNLPEDERDALTAHGEEDIRRALRHYMEHYNNGRPFIVAAHSQGSYVLTQLIVDHWGKLGIEAQLIAGYLIGWSITGEDLQDNPAIDICGEPRQTGCFISYNSVAAGKQGEAPMILKGAIVVNPLTWTRETKTCAIKPQSRLDTVRRGKPMADLSRLYLRADRRSRAGRRPCRPRPSGNPVLSARGLPQPRLLAVFFENIKSNAAQRIQAHLARKKTALPRNSRMAAAFQLRQLAAMRIDVKDRCAAF